MRIGIQNCNKNSRNYAKKRKIGSQKLPLLRTAEKEARVNAAHSSRYTSLTAISQALFVAQGKLLADATNKVFELETQRKENQHKIDRLKDYEQQIDQHIKVQRLLVSFTRAFPVRNASQSNHPF